jgi:hypothetical protein
MKEDGWDGWEPEANKTQWTLTGSLFYSIIVITTIGEFPHFSVVCYWLGFHSSAIDFVHLEMLEVD